MEEIWVTSYHSSAETALELWPSAQWCFIPVIKSGLGVYGFYIDGS